ncbi:MAG: DinB family protein [Chloroflexi bacterium]|nr:DinB family protein [Chloroflexota bacterium]
MTQAAEAPEDLRQLYQKLAEERHALLRCLAALSDEAAAAHPGGGWSAKQQAAHLCQAERTWVDWAFTVCDKPDATVGQTPQEGQIFLAEVEGADGYPLWYWQTRLKTARAETLRRLAIADLTADVLQRKGTHRTFGEMTVLQFLRGLYRHDRMHREQVQGKKQSFEVRAPGM